MFRKKGLLILKSVWTLFLAVITCVMIFSPRSEKPDAPWTADEIVKVFVIIICWLIALFAFTPQFRKIGNKKLFNEKTAKILTFAVLGIIALSFAVIGFLKQPAAMLIIVIFSVIPLTSGLLKKIKKARKQRKKKKS